MIPKSTLTLLIVASLAAPALATEPVVGDTGKQATMPVEIPKLSLSPGALTLDDAAPKADGFRWFADPSKKGLPLPFHTIEGYGGGAITPIAYLVNGGGPNTAFGLPSVAVSYVNLGSKNLEAFTISETLFNRVELSYGADRFAIGGLRGALVKATGVDVGSDVWLHNFNARVALLDEGAFGQSWIPAITGGASYKYNADIARINNDLGNALGSIGYRHSSGEDFTLTASKTIPKLVFGRPLILSAGARESQASNLGILGFSDRWATTFEGSVVYVPTDWLVVAYEFRQKSDPYNTIPGLINGEDNWHAIDVSWIVNKHATIVGGWGDFGSLANSEAHDAFWFQFKYEF